MRRSLWTLLNRPGTAAYVLLLPSLAAIGLFYLVPALASVAMSAMNLDIFLKRISFAGFGNYAKLATDGRFWNALGNTFYFTALELPLQIGLSLLLAAYLSRDTRYRRALRAFLFVPVICSMTAMGILWSLLLDPAIGILSYGLKRIGFAQVDFLKHAATAMPAVVATTVWKNFGLSMIILIAGMQNVPKQLYEAAEIDGASTRKRFFSITIPSIVPSLGFCVITGIIDSLRVFDQVYVMTQGGPLYATETIVQYIYNRGFRIAPYNLGYASAVAQALLVIIAGITILLYSRFLKPETD